MFEGKPLFAKPLGPSKLKENEVFGWNNLDAGTTREMTCEICGTIHPAQEENDEGRVYSRFLGRVVVEECCGRIFDIIYEESWETIVTHFLKEFADDPLDPRFTLVREYILPEALRKIAGDLTQEAQAAKRNETALAAINALADA